MPAYINVCQRMSNVPWTYGELMQNVWSTRSVRREILNMLKNISRARRVHNFNSVSQRALNVNDVSPTYRNLYQRTPTYFRYFAYVCLRSGDTPWCDRALTSTSYGCANVQSKGSLSNQDNIHTWGQRWPNVEINANLWAWFRSVYWQY